MALQYFKQLNLFLSLPFQSQFLWEWSFMF